MLDIKDVKKGNLVECLEDCGTEFTKGKIYEVLAEGYNKVRVDIVKDDEGHENGWLMKNFKLHEPKQDLRELLKVGYKVRYENSFGERKLDANWLFHHKNEYDDNLCGSEYWNSILEIYRPKYNGIKPMEWVLVWKREEERFTLRLAGNVRLPYYAHGNCKTRYDYTFRKSSKPVNEEKYQVAFTEAEIDNLPNQDLIKSLIKNKV